MRMAESLARAGHEAVISWFAHRLELFPWILRGVSIPRGVDVIHTSLALGQAFTGRGSPVVVTAHQYVLDPVFRAQRSRLQAAYHRVALIPPIRASLRKADVVTAVSAYIADAMAPDLAVRPKVIHNWVDTESFRPSHRHRAESDALRLLFVGNPSRWKGVDVIPELARRLGDAVEIHCLGGLRHDFPSELASLPNVKVLDRLEPSSMPALYGRMDAALVPTRYEAFGYVALEAMASGLPVVGFASTGTSEVCLDGETALLAPVDDVDVLESHVRRLTDPALRLRLGMAGRERAETVFSERKALDAYLETYKSLLHVSSPASPGIER